jgi:pectin methylesterase-like acyl-CoA thioesterase
MKRTLHCALLAAALCATVPASAACPGGAAWCDDFEHGARAWKNASGQVARTVDDHGNHVLLVAAGAALLADPSTPGDRYIEARVRPVQGEGKQTAILVVRYADEGNWIGAAIDVTPGSPRMHVDLVSMQDGTIAHLRQLGHDALPAGSFYTLRVELKGKELTAWLNGERLGASVDAAPAEGRAGLLAEGGGFELDDVRAGASGARPGRIALARMTGRVSLQAGDVRRYPVSALSGDGAALAFTAVSSDPQVATATVQDGALVLAARHPGSVTISLAGRADANVASAVAAGVGPAFAPPAGGRAWQGRLVPAPDASDVPPDTPLIIQFDQPPHVGTGGSVRIFRAADHALVDVINPAEEVDQLGYADQPVKRAVRYQPLQLDGSAMTIRPHSARLQYGAEYLVEIDAALFDGATIEGRKFEGLGEQAGWRFRTRAHAPTSGQLTVAAAGPADFRTVQGALNHAMQMPRGAPVTIRIANGRYDELLYLHGKDQVTLRGASRDGVVIAAANDDGINPGSGAGQGANSPAAMGGRSVFMIEDADLVTLDTLTLANTANRRASRGAQAEALYFNSNGRFIARNADFLSEQDTIQVKGYSWFWHTLIAGNVDFIWGANHAALFEDSEIRTVGDSAHPGSGGYVVQARTLAAGDPGFVFLNSRLTHGAGPGGNDVPPAAAWLARPGPASSWDNVSYINCRIDAHIAQAGWSWPKQGRSAHMGAGWNEYGSMDLAGRPLDLSLRAGGHVLGATEAARYAGRTQVFSGFDNGKGWNPSPSDSR